MLPEVGNLVFQELSHAILDLYELVPLVTQHCADAIRPTQHEQNDDDDDDNGGGNDDKNTE